MMRIHMLVYMYIHIHRWMNTILSQNIPPPPSFWLKKSFSPKKEALQLWLEVSPAMYNAISPHEQWEKTCAHMKKWQWTTPFMHKFFFGHEHFSKQCPWLTSFPFACDIGTYNWMTFCTHKKVTLDNPLYAEIFFWTWTFFKIMSMVD